MVRSLLVRGMLAGLGAGLVAAGIAALFGEPQITHAIAFDDQMRRLLNEPDSPVIVSRGVQSSIGMLTGMMVYGVSFGGIFAIVFAAVYGRLGAVRARATAALLAGAGFVAVYLVPTLKYPANPPSVGHPDTLNHRTELYVTMLLLSVAALVGAAVLGRRLVLRRGLRARDAAIVAGVVYLLVVALVMLALPGINEVPSGLSATLLWRFRLASVGVQLALWTTIGFAFGLLAKKILEPELAPPTPSTPHGGADDRMARGAPRVR